MLSGGGALAASPPTCPNGTRWDDGCLGADINAVFQTPNFFTCDAAEHCALAPGQAPYVTVPPWNVAGVDYPVGYNKTLRLKDPTRAALPAGCKYNGSTTAPAVVCANVASLALSGYDFGNTTWAGQTTGGGCVDLRVENIPGSISIKNNRWFNGPDNVYGQYGCGIENSYIVYVESNNASTDVTIDNNYCDINGHSGPAPKPNGVVACFVVDLPNNSADVYGKYNVCLHAYGRCFEVTIGTGVKALLYNYAEEFDYQDSALHGEFDLGGANGACTAEARQRFNTILQPAEQIEGGVTALVYGSSGAVGPCYLNYAVSNNTLAVVGAAATAIEVAYNEYKGLTFHENYIAPVGTVTGGCIYETSDPIFGAGQPVFSGNINMLTGHTIGSFEVCP